LGHWRVEGLPVQVLHFLLKMLFQKNTWVDKVVIMQISTFIVPKVFILTTTQKLQSEQALVRLLLATVEQLLRSVSRVERFFVLAENSEAVLKCGVFDLLGDFLVVGRCDQFE
jgi:hypothetical protein